MWFNASMAMTEMLVASSQVIGHRTGMMIGAGCLPNAAERAEFTLMGTEKLAAFSDASARAIRGWMEFNQQFSRAWFTAISNPHSIKRNLARAHVLSSSVARMTADVIDPLHVKATANARRLLAKPPGRTRLQSGY